MIEFQKNLGVDLMKVIKGDKVTNEINNQIRDIREMFIKNIPLFSCFIKKT